ncbi:aspartate/glutamate racemase family protein [Alkalihalobacillus sp. BA299]|uniref:aspartate/glutamate racemase family protein n=1 Tax=Alkalihalobacillus sp. BA299 TaxID=2815938 RepID=UPI001ADC19BD|nr:aspartate/glutamate racemase family protein [Alkalihalobacillus sp. BA299]
MLGIIRVLTTEDEAVLQEHSRMMKEEFNIDTVSRCIPEQWNGIHNDETLRLAMPKIEALVKSMVEQDGVSAVTISCAADPAVETSRNLVDVPVYGAGEVGAHTALMVSHKVGVLGITPEIPPNIAKILGHNLLDYTRPEGVSSTVDLLAEDAMSRAISACQELVNKGATSILFACTGFSTIGLKRELVKIVNVPIIDLVQAQAIAYSLTT